MLALQLNQEKVVRSLDVDVRLFADELYLLKRTIEKDSVSSEYIQRREDKRYLLLLA